MNEIDSLFELKREKFEPYSNKINGTVKDAITQYESRGAALNQLLSDYNAVISGSNIRNAINPWEYYHKGIKNIPVVGGVSVAEALFNTSAMSLYRQKPMEVIKAIYYRNKARNDSGLEKYFLDAFFVNIPAEKRIMVINPSPYVIEYIERIRKGCQYLVTDQTMADLYSKQYKESTFVPVSDDEKIRDIDLIIIFMQQADENNLIRMMEIISERKVAEAYGIIQTRFIDNKDSALWKLLSQDKCVLHDIVVVPNQLSNSSPKKKCMVSMVKSSREKKTIVHRAEYDPVSKEILLVDSGTVICQEELLKYATVRTLCLHIAGDDSTKKKTENVYATAQFYPFSKEIYVSYAIYPDERGYYGKAYYAATKNTQVPEIRGKSLTTRSEKGLRNKTKEEIIAALEFLPYESKMAAAIISDITKNFLNAQKPVTLKTLWFCLREDLLKSRLYDDETMRRIFSGRKQLASIYPTLAVCEDIKKAIAEHFKDGEEIQELRLVKQVNLIIDAAIKKGYLSENRVFPLLPIAQNRASKRQAEVRQALAKRSFEAIEENKIIRYLMTRYRENSVYLAVAIRLLTGMSIKEVCGLKWDDFRYDEGTKVYKLAVTKFVDNNGKLISHALEDNWEKYRVLPLGEAVSQMILSRKRHLVSMGIDEAVLIEYPIIMAQERIDHIRKGYKAEYCKPPVVAGKCREAVSKAEVPEHIIILPESGTEIETNINSFGGDIFRTNFRDKVLNDAGFGLDELNYYLGLKKPDTFSQHYCDYTNDYVQLIMAKKLDRWMDKYSERQNTQADNKDIPSKFTTNGIGGGVPSVEIEVLNLHEAIDRMITIDVETEHGFNVIVTASKRGDIN